METISEIGLVQKVDEQFVTIAVQAPTAGCGQCALANVCVGEEAQPRILKIPLTQVAVPLQPGQKVELQFAKIIQYSAIIYLMPILFFLAFLLIGQLFLHIENEIWLFAWGSAGLGVGLLVVYVINARISKTSSDLQINVVGDH